MQVVWRSATLYQTSTRGKGLVCLDGSFSSGSNCSNLLAIDTGDQKGAEKSIAKALSILPHWKDGKNIPDNIPLVGVATLDLSNPRWEYVVNCYT